MKKYLCKQEKGKKPETIKCFSYNTQPEFSVAYRELQTLAETNPNVRFWWSTRATKEYYKSVKQHKQ